MRIKGKFLNSTLGRRLFTLFCACSLVPLTIMAVVSYSHIKTQLKTQSQRNLQQSCKSMGMGIYERMILLGSELERVRTLLQNYSNTEPELWEGLDNMFVSLTVLPRSGPQRILLKTNQSGQPPVGFTNSVKLNQKLSILIKRDIPCSRVFIALPLHQKQTDSGILLGEINASFLWKIGSTNILPPETELLVIDENNNIIVSSITNPEAFLTKVPVHSERDRSSQFEWSGQNQTFLARYWTIFMESRFNSNSWTVFLSQPKDYLFISVDLFQRVFPMIIILSFLIVVFFSMINIRQILDPLEKLKDGIRSIARQDFQTRIDVNSRDEFQDVANAFNNMTKQLDKQFRTIRTNSEIDRAILSSLEPEVIVNTMLIGMRELLSCNAIAITLKDPDNPAAALSHILSCISSDLPVKHPIRFDADDIVSRLHEHTHILIRAEDEPPAYLFPFEKTVAMAVVLPVFINKRLEATIILGYPAGITQFDDDIRNAFQLADQMAVALANSNLVRELDQLNDGALTALAKTVDAKSPWTAGHSERVGKMAQKIAGVLGIEKTRLDILHRAALLHDIGKVGIPNAILEKPGRLTDDEYTLIKDHPAMGARILAPIKVYKEVIPIVRQHHERFDGKGYPDGLAGENIVLEARIMAISDVYDALISDRPYRSGWDLNKVIRFVQENSGSHFDPKVVEAFTQIMTSKQSLFS